MYGQDLLRGAVLRTPPTRTLDKWSPRNHHLTRTRNTVIVLHSFSVSKVHDSSSFFSFFFNIYICVYIYIYIFFFVLRTGRYRSIVSFFRNKENPRVEIVWIRSDWIDQFFFFFFFFFVLLFAKLFLFVRLFVSIFVVLVDYLLCGALRRSPSSRHCLICLSEAFDYVLSAL